MTRGAIRDLYDLNYMVNNISFNEVQLALYKKCVIFYFAIATENPICSLEYTSIDKLNTHNVKTQLHPVVRDRESFELEKAKRNVKMFLEKTIKFDVNDIAFLKQFGLGFYHPELLFDNVNILDRIANHPMALWKTQKRQLDRENIEFER